MSRVMDENLGGIRVVRAFAAQEHEMEKFEATSKHALELAHERIEAARHQHVADELLVLPRDGSGAVGRRLQGDRRRDHAWARSRSSSPS